MPVFLLCLTFHPSSFARTREVTALLTLVEDFLFAPESRYTGVLEAFREFELHSHNGAIHELIDLVFAIKYPEREKLSYKFTQEKDLEARSVARHQVFPGLGISLPPILEIKRDLLQLFKEMEQEGPLPPAIRLALAYDRSKTELPNFDQVLGNPQDPKRPDYQSHFDTNWLRLENITWPASLLTDRRDFETRFQRWRERAIAKLKEFRILSLISALRLMQEKLHWTLKIVPELREIVASPVTRSLVEKLLRQEANLQILDEWDRDVGCCYRQFNLSSRAGRARRVALMGQRDPLDHAYTQILGVLENWIGVAEDFERFLSRLEWNRETLRVFLQFFSGGIDRHGEGSFERFQDTFSYREEGDVNNALEQLIYWGESLDKHYWERREVTAQSQRRRPFPLAEFLKRVEKNEGDIYDEWNKMVCARSSEGRGSGCSRSDVYSPHFDLSEATNSPWRINSSFAFKVKRGKWGLPLSLNPFVPRTYTEPLVNREGRLPLVRVDRGTRKARWSIQSKIGVQALNGLIPLFSDRAAEIVEIKLSGPEGEPLTRGEDQDYDLVLEPGSWSWFVKLHKDPFPFYQVRMGYGRITQPTAHEDLFLALREVDSQRLRNFVQELNRFGFTVLAAALQKRVDSCQGQRCQLSAEELATLFYLKGRYTYDKKGTPLEDPDFFVGHWAHFSDCQGRFKGQCDSGNGFLDESLTYLFEDNPRIAIKRRYVRQFKTFGYMKLIGHVVNELYVDNHYVMTVDGTPSRWLRDVVVDFFRFGVKGWLSQYGKSGKEIASLVSSMNLALAWQKVFQKIRQTSTNEDWRFQRIRASVDGLIHLHQKYLADLGQVQAFSKRMAAGFSPSEPAGRALSLLTLLLEYFADSGKRESVLAKLNLPSSATEIELLDGVTAHLEETSKLLQDLFDSPKNYHQRFHFYLQQSGPLLDGLIRRSLELNRTIRSQVEGLRTESNCVGELVKYTVANDPAE